MSKAISRQASIGQAKEYVLLCPSTDQTTWRSQNNFPIQTSSFRCRSEAHQAGNCTHTTPGKRQVSLRLCMAVEPPSPGQLRLKAGTAVATVCVTVALLMWVQRTTCKRCLRISLFRVPSNALLYCRHDWEQDLGRDNVMSNVRPAVKSVFNNIFGGDSKRPSDRS